MPESKAGVYKRLPKALAVVLGLGALLMAPEIMPKNPPQYMWNFTNSAPLGVYKRLEERDADLSKLSTGPVFVTFCLPQDLKEAPFFARFCSPRAPDKQPILKRFVAEQTTGGLVVRGDTETSLDSRVVGAIEDGQIQGFWRPLLTWDANQ